MRLLTIKESITLSSVDPSKAPKNCEECGNPDGDLRPYGKGGKWVCFECAMANEEETSKRFKSIMNGKGGNGVNVVTIDEAKSFDWDKIMAEAFEIKRHDEGDDDGIDTLEKFKALPGKQINNGYCTYIARAANELYDVDDWHINNKDVVEDSDLCKWLKTKGVMPQEHSWFEHDNKYYDYEAQQGVDELYELPFFKRLTKTNENKEGKRSAAVDFDATIHSYTSGFQSGKFDPPIEGAIEGVNELCQEYDIVYVFTARDILGPVEKYMKDQFKAAGIPYPKNLQYTNVKPAADIYIDDRGYKFEGDWKKTLKDVKTHKPWNVKESRLQTIAESLKQNDLDNIYQKFGESEEGKAAWEKAHKSAAKDMDSAVETVFNAMERWNETEFEEEDGAQLREMIEDGLD